MQCLNLPNELVVLIAKLVVLIDDDAPPGHHKRLHSKALVPLSRTNRQLHEWIYPMIIRHNIIFEHGSTLHWACEHGLENLADRWLQAGADVNGVAGECQTPLQWALRCGHTLVAKKLLAHPKLDLSRWSFGRTPSQLLWVALNYYQLESARLLLHFPELDINTVAHDGHTTLFTLAAGRGHVNLLQTLIARDDLYVPFWWKKQAHWRWGGTPLDTAASCGYLEVVKLLIGTGWFDVDLESVEGAGNLLQSAAEGGSVAVINYLLQHPKVRPSLEYGCAKAAFREAKRPDVAAALLADPQTDPNSEFQPGHDPLGLTRILIWASEELYSEVVRLVLKRRQIDPNHRIDKGKTPLILVAKTWHPPSDHRLEWTSDRGRRGRRQHNRRRHLWMPEPNFLQRMEETFRVLIEAGADPNCAGSDNKTPLTWCIHRNPPTLVRILLDTGRINVWWKATKHSYIEQAKMISDNGEMMAVLRGFSNPRLVATDMVNLSEDVEFPWNGLRVRDSRGFICLQGDRGQ